MVYDPWIEFEDLTKGMREKDIMREKLSEIELRELKQSYLFDGDYRTDRVLALIQEVEERRAVSAYEKKEKNAMSSKKGTVIGRIITSWIPDDSPLNDLAESVDGKIEDMVFDKAEDKEVPALEHQDSKDFLTYGKEFLLALAEKGLISINYPGPDDQEDEKIGKMLSDTLTSYVNDTLD